MRELKFRGWCEGSYKYDIVVIDEANFMDCWDGWVFKGEVEQYTGLKDKNGKEIYEGDIVKVYYKQRLLGSYQLIWDNLNAVYELSKTNNYDDAEYVFGGANYRYCVIGNIHENKELLDE